jgi:hypothetical protein
MANYALTRYTTGLKDTVDEALAALETQLETVDSTANPIQGMGIEMTGRDRQQCIGWVIYDT